MVHREDDGDTEDDDEGPDITCDDMVTRAEAEGPRQARPGAAA